MVKLQIKLLHLQYGWSAEEISKLLDIPTSAVRMYIEEILRQEPQPEVEVLPPAELAPYCDTPNGGAASLTPYDSGIRDLKTREVSKQLEISPVIAAIELTLLQKVMEAAKSCDEDNPAQLASIVDTFKKLTRDSIINTVIKTEEKQNEKNSPQVAVQILQFRD